VSVGGAFNIAADGIKGFCQEFHQNGSWVVNMSISNGRTNNTIIYSVIENFDGDDDGPREMNFEVTVSS
jgi:hypothetical protein